MSLTIASSFTAALRQSGPAYTAPTRQTPAEHTREAADVPSEKGIESRFDLAKLPYLTGREETEESNGLPPQDPEVARYSREKYQARETFERLVKELKMVRKVWANKPEELAEQLLRLGAELAKVAKQYQAAQKALAQILGERSGMGNGLAMPAISAPAVGATSPSADPSDDVGSSAETAQDAGSDAEAEANRLAGDAAELADDNTSSTPTPDTQAVKSGAAAYEKVQMKTVRLDESPFAMELRGDIEFASGLRGFATKLREALEEVVKKAPNLPGASRERDEFLEKAGEALEELESEMFKYLGALKRAMPPALRVSQPVSAVVA